MKEFDFNNMEWHDAILSRININREDPGHTDILELFIQWPDEKKSLLIFRDVYLALMRLNFGVVSDESIYDASLLEEDTLEKQVLIAKWKPHYPGIEAVKCYEIRTNSTNSNIQIFAMSVENHEL